MVRMIDRPLGRFAQKCGRKSRSAAACRKVFSRPDLSATDTGTQLWSDDAAKVGMFDTRQRLTMAALNQLMVCLFRQHLQGAVRMNLRKAVSFAVPNGRHAAIKAATRVSLYQQP